MGHWGGLEGAPNDAILNPRTPDEREVRKVTNLPTKHGDLLSIRSGGGGGYGPPWERDPARVLDDVIDGYVSLESAREQYKAVIEQKNNQFMINEDVTRNLRANVPKLSGSRKANEGSDLLVSTQTGIDSLGT